MGGESVGLLYVPIRVQFVPSCVVSRGDSCNSLSENELSLHLADPVLAFYGKLPPGLLLQSAQFKLETEVDSGILKSF